MIIWIIQHWSVIILVVPILAAFLIAWYLFGRWVAAPIGIVGIGLLIFLMGRKIERDTQQKRVQDIQDKREKAYEKIDSRDTSPSDAADRLRDGTY